VQNLNRFVSEIKREMKICSALQQVLMYSDLNLGRNYKIFLKNKDK
jgi:hypothetical protein